MASKLTEKHDELIAKKEAARKVAEKLEKKKKDNARKKRGREVSYIQDCVLLSHVTQLLDIAGMVVCRTDTLLALWKKGYPHDYILGPLSLGELILCHCIINIIILFCAALDIDL